VSGGSEDGAMATDDGATPAASEPSAGQAFELTVEWALWGRRATDPQDRVLDCSAGALHAEEFARVIARYVVGTPDRLPQYTVGWVPGADGPEFVAVAIREEVPYGPAQPGVRGRYDAFGGGTVTVRLFCVRYVDLAEHKVSYAELLDAVQRQELPPRAAATGPVAAVPPAGTGPITIGFAARPQSLPVAGFAHELAERVAVLLLTEVQICVLGAYEVPAADRLAFMDAVMSLLPYGLRANLSGSTWASSTVQELKLRLFFANAPREDGNTLHVRWGQPDPAGLPEPDSEAAKLYLAWLRRTGPQARSQLAGQTAPLRFTSADIRRMVSALPRDSTVTDTLEDLAAALNDGDDKAARAEARRLEHNLVGGPLDPADQARYRDLIGRLGLLKDHRRLHPGTKASVYRVLLDLAFEAKLSYAGYCKIEDAVGHPPRGTLRSVLLKRGFATVVPWLLVVKAEPSVADETLMESLADQGIPETASLTTFLQDIGDMRVPHRAVVYDFAVYYLHAKAKDARKELIRRGYLADTLEIVFPGDQKAQQIRLEDTLRLVYGERLTRGQIRELFVDRKLHPTAAFEAAVTALASWPNAAQFIAAQAAYPRLAYAGDGDQPLKARGPGLWRRFLRDLGVGTERTHRDHPPK
jgi:hypothetical protein